MRWPLWDSPLVLPEVRQLFLSDLLAERTRLRSDTLSDLGVQSIVEAPIRRSDQGGYGSFGAASVICSTVGL